FHFSIHGPVSDNSATSLSDYLFSQNSRIPFRKLSLKILLYTSIFSYFELMCEQYVTFIKPSIHYGQIGKKLIIYSRLLSRSFKFQLLCIC
uniref:Uncharacterized protein n=1 Tax=Cebus imitator TaxID=2715852 RepID=A0A2K5R2J8_CEBIM